MTNTEKIIVAVAIGVAAVLGIMFPKVTKVVTTQLVGAIGDTQSTAKIAQITANGNGTYISGAKGAGRYKLAAVYNSDANDRVINTIDAFYTGLGTVSTSTLTSFGVTAATSSVATSFTTNTNYVYQAAVGTSTTFAFEASSTPGVTSTTASNYARVWKAGTYVVFESNATTSAGVVFRVGYIGQ